MESPQQTALMTHLPKLNFIWTYRYEMIRNLAQLCFVEVTRYQLRKSDFLKPYIIYESCC